MSRQTTSPDAAQEMMTLASLCYDKPDDIKTYLKDTTLATEGRWELVWGPAIKGSNLAYVVKNTTVSKGDRDQYAIAIRGTIITLTSILEDIEIFHQVPLPWASDNTPMLSRGIAHGWNNLSEAQSPEDFPATSSTLEEFIRSIPSNSTVNVTGHSQGAALAAIVAAWISDILPELNVLPYTFAAETPGNEAFANYFNGKFLGKPGGRYYHHHDIVPKGFAVADMETIKTIYAPEPPGVETTFLIGFTVSRMLKRMKKHNISYMHCGNDMCIPDTLIPCTDVHFWNRQKRFDGELGAQHSNFTYLRLLGAPLTPGVPSDPWPPQSIPFPSS